MKSIIRLVLALVLFLNITLYGVYSMSFTSEWRPADISRGEAAILLAIYFVGMALLITQKED